MKISFIAFDSFGVKSSCTLVKTKDVVICIDPGIAVETVSFPLPWSEKLRLRMKYEKEIKNAVKKSDVVIITHYHYDHYMPEGNLYKDKALLIKDPEKNINQSQRERSSHFLGLVENKAKDIEIADRKKFQFGDTTVEFSKPLWHGMRATKLGKVLMVTIDDGKNKLLFSSDIDGPYIENYSDLIIKKDPEVIILDGAPTYLLGFIMSFKNLKRAIKNTIKILEKTNAKLYILDHHLLRDYRYKELYYEVYEKARDANKRVCSAAEFIGKRPSVLDGYKEYGPTRWKEWEKLTTNKLNEIIRHAKKVGESK